MVRRSPHHILFLFVLAVAPAAFARVLSYSPYTNRAAMPAYQLRTASQFVLVEAPGTQFTASQWMDQAEVVVYDVQGAHEPRVIFPPAGDPRVPVSFAAHGRGGAVLIQTTGNYQGRNAQHQAITLLGDTTGTSWKHVQELDGAPVYDVSYDDLGGYYTRGLRGAVRPVSSGQYLFVIEVSNGIWGVRPDGTAKRLVEIGPTYATALVGSDATGSRILARKDNRILLIDLETEAMTDLGEIWSGSYNVQGWVAGPERAYVLTTLYTGQRLWHYRKGLAPQIVGEPYPVPGSPPPYRDPWSFIAAPTHDYAGAWMIQRDPGKPTTLLRHTELEGVKTFWSDITGPEVEALHPGAGGERLLIQVHRPRVQPERWFIDPALAIWKIGDPAPRQYDELFVAETNLKGFVHLDVNATAQGHPFVFDSGIGNPPESRVSPPISGGGDVVQEWGIVRSSLKQELVLPGIARLPGAFNSYWRSDVVIYNPTDAAQPVVIRYAPLDGNAQTATTTITLGPREIRVVADALKEWFGVETGGGSLHLEPGTGVMATGRTYTSAAAGTYGFSMPAMDALTAAGARFPLSFAGAFPGGSLFRTNILLTAPKGLAAGAHLQAYGVSGVMGSSGVTLSTINAGVSQTNNVSGMLSLSSHEEGGLVVRPTHGFLIPTVVAIDNITNDPTYFPPDLPAPVVRTIPVVGHLDGANNSKFRSDLYLINLSSSAQMVRLEAKAWDRNEAPKIVTFSLLPNEDRVIKDVLPRLFGMTGFARLSYMSMGTDGEGVRVTSRTYNLLENGGTLGCLIPPLNSFQSAASGEVLEILGVVGDSRFRANIGLVELSPFGGQAPPTDVRIRIINESGVQIDTFQVVLPMAGGMQINDVLRERGLTAAKAVLIRIEPNGPGLVGAYATLTDNGTNDPSFLAASLGATE